MELLPDKHNCHETEKSYNVLLSIGKNIVSIPYQTFGRHSDTFGDDIGENIDQLAFNSKNGEIFVAANKAGKIYTIDMNNKRIFELVNTFIFNISSMAYGELFF